jgi:primosomal protein N' (replication factor Y)
VALLGSATPSLESHHGALQGRLTEVTLRTRPTGGTLPKVELVDLCRTPPDQPLAPPLVEALRKTLAAGEQTILFLNRRGWSGFVLCRTCGRQWRCDNCSVSLKHHRAAGQLRCHYCDHHERFPRGCPDCGDPDVGLFKLGTEQLQAHVKALLPQARVVRLDRDTVSRKHGVEKVVEAMRIGDIDVLVGTQMVTKGHDFPGVTLVGVVAADLALNLADFRAAERTFQLLTQVAGRAGRGDRPGRVIIQSFAPGHFALIAAKEHDYAAFSEQELGIRKELGYPPFGHMVAFKLSSEDDPRVRSAAAALARALADAAARSADKRCAVLGPNRAPLELLRGRHRWQLIVKGPDRTAVRALARAGRATMPERVLNGVRLAIDVDPIHML